MCRNQIGPTGRLNTYIECTTLPTFMIARLPRLYEERSLVRAALTSMGR